jgi:hypothetical protein
MAELFRQGWLIGLVKHAIWADSLYFLYLPLLSFAKILAFRMPGDGQSLKTQ